MTENNTVTINTDFKGWAAVKDDALRVLKTKGSYDRLLAANPDCTLDNVQDYAKAFAAAAMDVPLGEFNTGRGTDGKLVKDRFGTSLRAAIERRDGKPEVEEDENVALLTSAGKSAALEAVIEAWHAAQTA